MSFRILIIKRGDLSPRFEPGQAELTMHLNESHGAHKIDKEIKNWILFVYIIYCSFDERNGLQYEAAAMLWLTFSRRKQTVFKPNLPARNDP